MGSIDRVERLILQQAERSPAAVAVEHAGARLTYAELKSQALEISNGLQKIGLNPGDRVAIFQHRSLATVPLLLGIWEAGGVVVPINPNTPTKMLEWIVQSSAPRVIVTDAELKQRVHDAANEGEMPGILTHGWHVNGHSRNFVLPPLAEPLTLRLNDTPEQTDDCYVYFTSGSQGRPKGVRGSHKGLVHYLKWQAKEFAVTETDRFSQIAPLSFDFSLKEFLVPLICGARVCIADRNTLLDPAKFVEWVREMRITVMCCVPTLFRSLLELSDDARAAGAFESLRCMLISGDMLRWDDVMRWRERFGNSIALFNLYGPTESTIIKLFYPIPEQRCGESLNVPVGKPIPGADVMILDDTDERCAIGETGDLVIVSEWLARGYLNGHQNAHGSFQRLAHNGKTVRAYRTGDLGRLLSDGNVELMGRRDRQVKIRGYRIELDEIECVIAEHQHVRDVAVVTNKAGTNGVDDVTLITCFFTSDDQQITEQQLKQFAQERLLPQVLSLTQFVRLDELPLSVNGKVDRLRLESLAASATFTEQRAPESINVQQRIASLWEELLGVDYVDIDSNFFEVGGDSMTAIRLLRRMREELHPQLKLGDVYEFPSISKLSARVKELTTLGQENPEKVEDKL